MGMMLHQDGARQPLFSNAERRHPVDKVRLTQVGRALSQLGIDTRLFAAGAQVEASERSGRCRVGCRRNCGCSASAISRRQTAYP